MFWEAPPFGGGESSLGAPSPALGIHNSSTVKSFQGWVSSGFACLYRRRRFFTRLFLSTSSEPPVFLGRQGPAPWLVRKGGGVKLLRPLE